MPLFAALADMQARFEARDLLQLTDDDDEGVVDEARIDRALAKADAVITGYVAARHKAVEDLAGNASLTEIACDLAYFELFRHEAPEHVEKKRKAAIRQLEDISVGRFKLDQGTETQPPRDDAILTGGSDKRFSRDTLDGY